MVFHDIEQLKEFLETDKNRNDLSPVRYINVETLDMWVKLKTFLIDICSEIIFLSVFCEQNDTTPNLKQMMNRLRKTNKNTLVVPLSEHLRVNNEIAKSTLEKILKMDYLNYEFQNNFKIYIPIYRMKSLLKSLPGDDIRYNNSFLFLEASSDIDYALTIIQNSLDVKIAGNEIFGYKKYLSYWEQNPDKPIILHTSNAIHYANVVFADDVKVIVNAFDLLKYHYNLKESIKRQWGNDNQWYELAKRFKVGQNIDTTLLDILSVTKYDQNTLLSNWKKYSDLEKWALWLLIKIRAKSDYIGLVINNCSCFDNFENSMCCTIIDLLSHEKYNEFYIERKKLIEIMQLNNFTVDFYTRLNGLNPFDRIKCLTDITEKEKKSILLSLQRINIDNSVLELLKTIYNDLYLYLQISECGSDIFEEYFSKYKICKIQDSYNDDFAFLVNEIAKNKGVWWTLDSRNYIVDTKYSEGSLIYYIDALGLEYLPILKSIFESRGLSIDIQVGYCNIPSITELNNDFTVNRRVEKEFELDHRKHEKADYPLNILNELELIKKFADRAIRYLDENKKVIITTDHGSSRLAVIAKKATIKANDTATVLRHGRYCVDDKQSYGYVYECCIDKDQYHVFANHDRFSISGAALGEVHGGATLEEVLVPVITIQADNNEIKEQVKIEILTPEIKQTVSGKIIVKFKLNKKFDKVVAVVQGKRYVCKYSNNCWSFEPEIGKADRYTANIVSNETLGSFEYKIKKGISSNFDI